MENVIQDCLNGTREVKTVGPGWNKGKQSDEKEEADEDEELTLDSLAQPKPKAKKQRTDMEEQQNEVWKWVRTLEPIITLLEPGQFSKRVPYRCSICKTASWPQGKVGEASEMKLAIAQHFIGNHLKCETHLRNARNAEILVECEEPKIKCPGVCTTNPEHAHVLYPVKAEFHLWATMSNFEEFARHKYQQVGHEKSWIVRAHECAQECAEEEGVCKKCSYLAGPRGVIRSVLRFLVKYYCAQLLHTRLFHGQEAFHELKQKIKKGPAYERYAGWFEKMLEYSPLEMQCNTRNAMLKDGMQSPTMAEFVDIVVRPCMQINVNSVSSHLDCRDVRH